MVMRLRSLIVVRSIFIIGCVISIGGEPSAQQGWHTYCHARFGQCADIPPNFQSDPPPVNGDGLGFRDPYGMSIAVFARNNVQSSTLSSERSELLNEKRFPAYQAAGRDWFVLSGGADNKIYYIRRIVTPETIATLWIEYPIQRRAKRDARSFNFEDISIVQTHSIGNFPDGSGARTCDRISITSLSVT